MSHTRRLPNLDAEVPSQSACDASPNGMRIVDQLSLALQSIEDVENTLRLSLEAALHISGLDWGGIYLRHEDTGEFYLAVHQGFSQEWAQKAGKYAAESAYAGLILAGRPVCSANQEAVPTLREVCLAENLAVLALIPFQFRGEVTGFLQVASHLTKELEPPVLSALETIAALTGACCGRLQGCEKRLQDEVQKRLAPIEAALVDRLQVELALDRERRVLRTLIDNLPDQIFAHDRDCRFTLNNLADAQVMGTSDPETLLNKSDLDFYPPEIAARFQADDRHVMDSGQPLINREELSVRKDGSKHWILTTKVPLHDSQGQVIGLVGVAHDITDRKTTEDELYQSRLMLQLVLDTIPQRVFWKDRQSVFLGCNRAFAIDAGLTDPAGIVGKHDFDFFSKESSRLYQADDRYVMETDIPKLNFEESQLTLDGKHLWLRTNKVPLHDRDGNVIGILGTYEDITNNKRSEEELKEANQKLRTWIRDLEERNLEANLLRQMDSLLQVCNASEEAYAVINQFGPQLFHSTNGAVYIISNSRRGVEAEAVWGDDFQSSPVFGPDDCWALRRGQTHMVDTLAHGLRCKHIFPTFSGCYLDVPMVASGEALGVLHIESTAAGALGEAIQNLAGTVGEHLALALSNIRLRETLRAQSIRDVLTGLFNRRYMEESLERELHRALRRQTPIGLIMVDIDHFKDFNDTYGHDAGDVVLHEMGKLLKSHVRGEDIACRFGGEEFILILPDSALEATLERSEQILRNVKLINIAYRHRPLGVVTVSIGVAEFPGHGKTVQEILQKVDEALYLAKRRGRDRVEVATIIEGENSEQ